MQQCSADQFLQKSIAGACSVNAIRLGSARARREIVLIILRFRFSVRRMSAVLMALGQIWAIWMMDCICSLRYFLLNPNIVNFSIDSTNCRKTWWNITRLFQYREQGASRLTYFGFQQSNIWPDQDFHSSWITFWSEYVEKLLRVHRKMRESMVFYLTSLGISKPW